MILVDVCSTARGGQKLREIAWEMREKQPVIMACDAIIVARVAKTNKGQ